MFKKLTQLFQGSKETPEQIYLQENQLSFDSERGPVIKDVVINEKWSEHLEYFQIVNYRILITYLSYFKLHHKLMKRLI